MRTDRRTKVLSCGAGESSGQQGTEFVPRLEKRRREATINPKSKGQIGSAGGGYRGKKRNFMGFKVE